MDIGLLGFLSLSQRLVFWERYLDVELSGFLAPPGDCYFGKGSGYRALGIFGPSPSPTNLGIGPQIREALYIGNLLY